MTIKKISTDDAKTIAEIHAKCFTENWNEDNFRNMLINSQYFGFTISDYNEVCGFILCRHLFEEIEIITFCVLPQYRKRNFGRTLINEVIKHASLLLCSKIFLEVANSNIAAINLYKSIGFQKISERKQYYTTQNESIDADIMMIGINNLITKRNSVI